MYPISYFLCHLLTENNNLYLHSDRVLGVTSHTMLWNGSNNFIESCKTCPYFNYVDTPPMTHWSEFIHRCADHLSEIPVIANLF